MSIIGRIFKTVGGNKDKASKTTEIKKEEIKDAIKQSKTIIPPPGDRSSERPVGNHDFNINGLKNQLSVIKPDFQIDAIPLIRKLYKVNEDVGSVLYDAIQLTNTGHVIKFSQDVKPAQADKMRRHLERVSKNWHMGAANIDGLVNKWIAQIYVSGALSIEWVPTLNLDGIAQNVLVNPETVRFAVKPNGTYKALQQRRKQLGKMGGSYKELNPNTYMYFGLFSDEDTPYGIPPFLTALKALELQGDMKTNIKHILNQLGLLGYLEVTVDKPMQEAHESESTYKKRLMSLLSETKQNLMKGFKDGIVVGFTEDHEFEFHATTKNLNGVGDMFNLNERQVANGLKTSPSFLGVNGGSTETFMSIVFTKTLSQLKNTQDIIATALEKGYELELMLAGFDYPGTLKVEFNQSTITDEVKIQQGREYKQRVLSALFRDYIISAETYAEEMGYQKPYKSKDPKDLVAIQTPKTNDITKEDADKDTKNKSARKSRDTVKDQPKRKDTNTKP